MCRSGRVIRLIDNRGVSKVSICGVRGLRCERRKKRLVILSCGATVEKVGGEKAARLSYLPPLTFVLAPSYFPSQSQPHHTSLELQLHHTDHFSPLTTLKPTTQPTHCLQTASSRCSPSPSSSSLQGDSSHPPWRASTPCKLPLRSKSAKNSKWCFLSVAPPPHGTTTA